MAEEELEPALEELEEGEEAEETAEAEATTEEEPVEGETEE